MGLRNPPPIRLELIEGPPLPRIQIGEKLTLITLGRNDDNTIVLKHDAVSRYHLMLMAVDELWYVGDVGSLNGTKLCGVPLAPPTPTPLTDADDIQVGPWTFRVRIGVSSSSFRFPAKLDDSVPGTKVRTLSIPSTDVILRTHFLPLLRSAAQLASARSQPEMLAMLLELAQRLTRYERGVVLRPGVQEGFEVVIARVQDRILDPGEDMFPISRSLLRAAAKEAHAIPADTPISDRPDTFVQREILAAACSPIRIGDVLWGYLYLDAGRTRPTIGTDELIELLRALCDTASAAITSIRQRDAGLAYATLQKDLDAAAEVQRTILPQPRGSIAGVEYAYWLQPGRMVSGDIFGVTEAADGRVAVFLGDVIGKGLGAGLLMACIFSYLQCCLQTCTDPGEALTRLNSYLAPRIGFGKFASLWLGLIDPVAGTLQAADAGHGYCVIIDPDSGPARIEFAGGTPLGAVECCTFPCTTIALRPRSRLLLYSDGVTEVRPSSGQPFGNDGLLSTIAASRSIEEDIALIRAAVEQLGGNAVNLDDRTVASLNIATQHHTH